MVYRYLLITAFFFSTLFASNNLINITNFSADFKQSIVNESGKKLEYGGKIFVKNSGKALWEYKTPIIKNVYVLNDLVIVDEPELEQAIYTTLDKSINFKKLVDEAKKIDNNKYKTSLYDREYILQTKKDKISSLSFKDELGNSVLINFLNVKQNISIDDNIFKFLPPDYYDIIRK